MFPSLETPRLHLSPLEQGDAEFIYRHFSDPQVNQYLLDEPPISSLDQAQEIVDFFLQPTATTYNRWILVTKVDKQPIGTCGFHKWDKRNRRSEIGYDLTPSAWGQGYMSEALATMLEYGFTHLNLNRIEALVYPGNPASLKLLERFNFQKEGLLRDYFHQNGQFYDHWLLSLLKRQFKRIEQ
ncbi:MAG TPA: GNAT family protein [Trichocoleus sp.]